MKKYTIDNYSPEDLLQSGRDHIEAANFLFDKDPAFYDSAGYLAHLGIEIILKAILLFKEKQFPNTHDLQNLVEGVRVNLTGDEKRVLGIISDFEKLRYPEKNLTEIGTTDKEKIKTITDKIRRQIPDELLKIYKEKNPNQKGGRVLMARIKADD